jgi:hypothetical protein
MASLRGEIPSIYCWPWSYVATGNLERRTSYQILETNNHDLNRQTQSLWIAVQIPEYSDLIQRRLQNLILDAMMMILDPLTKMAVVYPMP